MNVSRPAATHPKGVASQDLLPGVVLVATMTGAAFALGQVPFLSFLAPAISAIFVGITFANVVGVPETARAGVSASGKRLLRIAVALLGLQLTIGQMGEIGWKACFVIVTTLVLTYTFTVAVGRVLGVSRSLSNLLAAGTSICGASAIAATNCVVDADEEDVSYAIAAITLFGTIAMILTPVAAAFLDLDQRTSGIWVGASVHEVAQVVGAGYQIGQEAGEVSIVSKLARVMLLAPVVIVIGHLVGRAGAGIGGSRPPLVPAFVVALLALTIVNSAGLIPKMLSDPLVSITPVLLTAALASLGLGTDFRKLVAKGVRPFALAAASASFVVGSSFLLLRFF